MDEAYVKQMAQQILNGEWKLNDSDIVPRVVECDGQFYVEGFGYYREMCRLVDSGMTKEQAQEEITRMTAQMIEDYKTTKGRKE